MDGSNAMVREKFPWVKLIANEDNVGFSIANNQAIRKSKGKYVLLLNPDTIVEEDTFKKCFDFMENHPKAGALGVRMVDGKGRFLPESKRGLPTPEVAFYKVFGLASLFPKSKRFGRYHLGYLDEFENHSIEILAGAFMWMRKDVLDEVGLLDETFFMYGEDIDLSWRIKLAGYENYYLSDTRIIHYKGESTKKGSINYVFVFYNAMIIFAEKHFNKQHAGLFRFFINLAIYFRAFLSLLKRLIDAIALPLVDFVLGSALLLGFLTVYQDYTGIAYPASLLLYAPPSYIALILLFTYLYGGYDKPIELKRIIKGVGVGTLALLVIYSLMPSSLRFSRVSILASGLFSLASVLSIRAVLNLLNIPGFQFAQRIKKRFGIVGSPNEVNRVEGLLTETGIHPDFVLEINPNDQVEKRETYVGRVSDLPEIIEAFHLNELIFCLNDLSGDAIISQMTRLNKYNLEYKIAPPESSFIIGSNSVNNPGEFYSFLALNNIGTKANQRSKRLLDFGVSAFAVISFPVLFWYHSKPIDTFRSALRVLIGKNTWVGYSSNTDQKKILPKIKPSIITLSPKTESKNKISSSRSSSDFNYANNYSIWKDLQLIWKNRKTLHTEGHTSR
jgi:GT2 family glycosyltransferase